MKKRNTVRPATLIAFDGQPLEYSVHKCPKLAVEDVRRAFPDQSLVGEALLLIPTFQPSTCELIAFTEESRVQKDLKLQTFFNWANEFRERVQAAGHWADFTDPSSGFPVHSNRGAHPFSDVSACELLLPYHFQHVCGPAGGCRVISHPKWRLAAYPATAFTTAPLDVVLCVLDSFETVGCDQTVPLPGPMARGLPGLDQRGD
eukprot:GGOE01053316.1.p1 GENE.GGOE01053316.1~~GGOE01053316.1.p1  ORF type:complete len:229 (-),score=47.65 GGOE01053316.1:424-1032(-)